MAACCFKESKVVDVREKGEYIWRKRECDKCGRIFFTNEVELVDDTFIKSMTDTIALVTGELTTMSKLIKSQAKRS